MNLLTQSDTLTNTNDGTSSDEYTELMFRSKGLHECCNDGHESTNCHTPSSSKLVGNGATKEETCNDSTNSVCCVTSAEKVGILSDVSYF